MQFVGSTSIVRRLWDRTLDRYPDTGQRYLNLGIVVLAAIVLYYELYVPAAVTPSIIADFGMTWPFFVYVIVVGNLVGAFAERSLGSHMVMTVATGCPSRAGRPARTRRGR